MPAHLRNERNGLASARNDVGFKGALRQVPGREAARETTTCPLHTMKHAVQITTVGARSVANRRQPFRISIQARATQCRGSALSSIALPMSVLLFETSNRKDVSWRGSRRRCRCWQCDGPSVSGRPPSAISIEGAWREASSRNRQYGRHS